MKRRTQKKQESRRWADEMRRMRRMRDKHYDNWAWIVIARAFEQIDPWPTPIRSGDSNG